MAVDATNIILLSECKPFWQVPYQVIELDSDEARENKALTVKEEEALLNLTSETISNILDEICVKEDLGLNAALEYRKLLAIYSLIDYLNVMKNEMVYCPNVDETYAEFINKKKSEFDIECVRNTFVCEYNLSAVYDDIFNQMDIPDVSEATAGGIGTMTINSEDCNIYTVHKIK